jgi:hypothetical protein
LAKKGFFEHAPKAHLAIKRRIFNYAVTDSNVTRKRRFIHHLLMFFTKLVGKMVWSRASVVGLMTTQSRRNLDRNEVMPRSKSLTAVDARVIEKSLDAELFEGEISAKSVRRERQIESLLTVSSDLLLLRQNGWTWDRIGQLVRRSAIADLDDETVCSVLSKATTECYPQGGEK